MNNIYSAGDTCNPLGDKWLSSGSFPDFDPEPGLPPDHFLDSSAHSGGSVYDDPVLDRSRQVYASELHHVPTQQEMELSGWVSRNLLEPVEIQLVPFSELPRYIPGTDQPVMGHVPQALAVETVTLQIGVQDVVVKHGVANGAIPNHGGGGKRGKITKLSKASMKRMKLSMRNVPDGSLKAMLTLTYPADFPCDGAKVKRDFAAMRKWLVRHHAGGVWVLEFQRRGAPHVHIFLTAWPAGGVEGVARAWDKIVGSGDEKHIAWHLGRLSGRPCLEWLRKPHVASLYATKYASKQEQKDVPEGFQNVGRFWGMFGKLRPVWQFVRGQGAHCAKATRYLVNNFRCSFDSRAIGVETCNRNTSGQQ